MSLFPATTTFAVVTLLLIATTARAAEPAAHAPSFDQAGLWPADVQKTAYYTQQWPKAPLLVWAKLEKTGADVDPKDPANWLEDGKPATRAPDASTDVLFPKGSFLRVKDKLTIKCRHLTLEEGVKIPDKLIINPVGNVWIKPKAGFPLRGSWHITGDAHTFFRNEGEPAIANKVMFNKAPDASVEILGAVKAWDELSFICGQTILGPDATMSPGDRSIQNIYPEAKLILMSGSAYHKRQNQAYMIDVIVAGVLQAGTPDRPLTRDATLGLSFKRKGADGPGDFAGSPNDFGLVVRPEGKLHVFSSKPETIHLVITWHGFKTKTRNDHEPDDADRKIDLVLQGDLKLDGVKFDRVLEGGIHVADRSALKNARLAFGQHNAASGEALFSVLDAPLTPKLDVSMATQPKPYSQQTEEERSR
jgi:hypothetical protein